MPENKAATVKSWTECAKGDLYGDVEEFSTDGDGKVPRLTLRHHMVVVVDKMDIGV